MVRTIPPALLVLLMSLPLALTGAAAQGFCTAPVPPPPLNGAEASPDQLRAAMARARAFIGEANLYENCLREETRSAGAADPADKDAQVRIAANHRLKDKVSSEAASAMEAYKKAHPN